MAKNATGTEWKTEIRQEFVGNHPVPRGRPDVAPAVLEWPPGGWRRT